MEVRTLSANGIESDFKKLPAPLVKVFRNLQLILPRAWMGAVIGDSLISSH
jgi:hypothetical protein